MSFREIFGSIITVKGVGLVMFGALLQGLSELDRFSWLTIWILPIGMLTLLGGLWLASSGCCKCDKQSCKA